MIPIDLIPRNHPFPILLSKSLLSQPILEQRHWSTCPRVRVQMLRTSFMFIPAIAKDFTRLDLRQHRHLLSRWHCQLISSAWKDFFRSSTPLWKSKSMESDIIPLLERFRCFRHCILVQMDFFSTVLLGGQTHIVFK